MWNSASNPGVLGTGGNALTTGGGGGGGYYGGGGGHYNGGGGGSSYAVSAALDVQHTQGDGTGNGWAIMRTPATVDSFVRNLSASGWQGYNVLNWTATQVTNATGYKIYWGTAPGVEPNVVNVTGANTSSWTHTGVTLGTTYYYRVAVVTSDGLETPQSVEVQATPSFTVETRFACTKAAQTYTVPAATSWISVDALGARGGVDSGSSSVPGKGGRVQALIPVASADSLQVNVGCTPTSGTLTGGWNGGGSTVTAPGAGGGGATDIRRAGTALSNRVLVAGGGAGAGGNQNVVGANGGGDGGGLIGATGTSGIPNNVCCTAGGGGSQSAGGAAGMWNSASNPGVLGTGGNALTTGGGGGGGYYGGGGGHYNGGGGGSSFTVAGSAGVTHTQGSGLSTGDGSLVITVPGSAVPLGVVAQPADSLVTIAWQASPVTALDSYRVYRMTAGGGWTLIGTVPAGTNTYNDTTAVNGTTYTYAVSTVVMVSGTPVESNKSSVLQATPQAPVTPSPLPTAPCAAQTYTVPSGVSWLTVDALGAGGAKNAGTSSPAGKGGRVKATIPVTPGETLQVNVGCSPSNTTLTGGWNGGGSTGTAPGAGGGGATDIRRGGGALANRVLVAGGGGGAGGNQNVVGGNGGGDGGGLIGATGAAATTISATNMPGGGGTQAAGGVASQWAGTPAAAGTLGNGGNGLNTGGGGGGGYYGGGGGNYFGSGGGSSYVTPGGVNVTHVQGDPAGTGNGSIAFSYIVDTSAPSVAGVAAGIGPGTYRAGTVIPVYVSFTEPVFVTGTPTLALNVGTRTVTLPYISGSGTANLAFSYTVNTGDLTPALETTGTSSLALAGGSIKDGAGSVAAITMPVPGAVGSLSDDAIVAIDAVPPAVPTGVTAGSGAASAPLISWAANNDADIAGYRVFGGTINPPTTQLTTLAADTLNFTFDAALRGVPYYFTVVAVDAAGNVSGASSVVTYTRPNSLLDITRFEPADTLTSASSIPYTLEFSDAVTGLTSSDFTVGGTATGWSVQSVTGSGTTYTVTIGGASGTSGTVALTLLQNAVLDASNAAFPGANISAPTVTVDRVQPTASWASPITPTNAAAPVFTLTFSEPVSGIVAGDFGNAGTATGCTFAPSAATGTSVTVTASGCSEGTVTPVLAAGSVSDAAGNSGPASAASATAVTIDRSGPTATWGSAPTSPTNAGGITFAVTFGEPVLGIAAADFTNQGTATGCVFTPSASTGTAVNVVVSGCSEGTVIPRLLAGTVTDASGNAGPAANLDAATVTIDRTPTTASWTPPASPTSSASQAFTLTFADAVTGIEAGDFTNTGTATGCTFGVSAATGTSVTVTVSNCSEGTVLLQMASGAVADSAGNASPATALTSSAITIDRTAPSVASVTPSAATISSTSFTYSVSFSEAVTGLAPGDFSFTGTSTGWSVTGVTGSGSGPYTVTVSGGATPPNGTVIGAVAAGSVMDAAGNSGPVLARTASTVTATYTLANTVRPVASGTPTAGSVLTVTDGTWTGATPMTFGYQWETSTDGLNWTDGTGSGATTASYTVGAGETGHLIRARVTATNARGSLAVASRAIAGSPATTPVLLAFKADSASTSASTTTFTVMFQSTPSGLTASDFSVGGTAAGWGVQSLTGSGAGPYTVTVGGTVTGTGTVSLSMNPGAVVVDGAAFPATATTATTSTTIDRSAPVVSAITPAATEVSTASTTFSVTFDEPVTGLAASDFTTGGTSPGWSATGVSGSGAGPYTVTVSHAGTPVDGTLALTLPASRVADAAGNAGPAEAVTSSTVALQYTLVNRELPGIGAAIAPGASVPAVTGTWVGAPTITFEYLWQVSTNGVDWTTATGAGATSATYVPVAGDPAKNVRIRVTATNPRGSLSAFSRPVQTQALVPTNPDAPQPFTVPAGVTSLAVDVSGASGADSGPTTASAQGGAGGRVTANLAVNPADVLQVHVGRRGSIATSAGLQATPAWNGGGNTNALVCSGEMPGAPDTPRQL